MSRLGGAERDLLRVMPSLTNYYQVRLATLRTCDEMLEICKQNLLRYLLQIHHGKYQPEHLQNTTHDPQILKVSMAVLCWIRRIYAKM